MTNFTYNPDIPDGPNNPSDDQPKMKINTNSTAGIINVDHIGFGQNNGGTHRQVTLTNEPAPGLGGGNGVLFANDANSNSWPFWQNSLQSFQIIGSNSANLPEFATNTHYLSNGGTNPGVNGGWTYLPGGMLIQWGIASSGQLDTKDDILFATPFLTFVGSIVVTPFRGNTDDKVVSIKTSSVSLTGFTINVSSSALPDKVSFIAIGA